MGGIGQPDKPSQGLPVIMPRMTRTALQRRAASILLVGVSLAFAWVVWPFIGAIFWGVVLTLVVEPLYRRSLPLFRQQRTLAALATLLLFIIGVGVPLGLVAALVLRQASAFYAGVVSGRIDFGAYLDRVTAALPGWFFNALDALGLGDFAAIQTRLAGSAVEASRFVVAHIFSISINSFDFLISLGVMLYLLFFLIRDGRALVARLEQAVPLADEDMRTLVMTFATVVRATVRGGVTMAAVQGVLGGLVLGFLGVPGQWLWGVVFGLLSMLPAVGAGLLWVPIAIYFLVTGALWKAAFLIVFGSVVLTAIDNFLRPLLVGRDTQMPSYLILISTLGGVAGFGLNGVVIGPVAAALFVASWTLFEPGPQARIR
ncbi:MAG: AI-2E family transporter [Caldimonas sp.]